VFEKSLFFRWVVFAIVLGYRSRLATDFTEKYKKVCLVPRKKKNCLQKSQKATNFDAKLKRKKNFKSDAMYSITSSQ
jgi:hypothetical protein